MGVAWGRMVWYGIVWYGMVWYVVFVVAFVKAPSTFRREKLPNTLSLGRAKRSSRPASRWPGVCRQRPRGGGGGGGAWSGGVGGARVEEGEATCGSHTGALGRLAGGELLVVCDAAVVGSEGGAVTLGWGMPARVHGHSTPCPNVPPRWPSLVCGRGVARSAGPCF